MPKFNHYIIFATSKVIQIVLGLRISYSIPDEIARQLESSCTRIGYPSSRAFLRALTIWATARMSQPTPDVMSEYAEEVKAMFAELTDSEATDFGNAPTRHHRKCFD